MKTRETFDKIRQQKVGIFSLKNRLILLVSAEIVVSVILALLVATIINESILTDFDWEIPLFIELVVVSLFIGWIVTSFLSKLFFDPIKKLRKAMEKVADGDFSVRLNIDSSSQEIREIYSGFNLMAQELGATEILQTDFVSNVSHEIKTPINAIEGYATLLQDCDNLNGEQREYIEKIYQNTQRLSKLVGNILLLSKIDNQVITTKPSIYRLDEQIRQVIVLLEPEWSKMNIEFDVEMDNIDYIGHENLLFHVWTNLIGNAIKFNMNEGSIRIQLLQEADHVKFTIADNGSGISEDATKHIFDKFYQSDSSHKEEGNGLGLALVKRILEISNGEISVQNITDGCEFTVKLY